MKSEFIGEQAVINALEEARCTALVTRDLKALDELCADCLVYTHTSTRRDTKASYIDRVRSGFYEYLAFERVDCSIAIAGPTALVTGRLRTDVIVDGIRKSLDNAILSVWILESNVWRFAAYQPTPIPPHMLNP